MSSQMREIFGRLVKSILLIGGIITMVHLGARLVLFGLIDGNGWRSVESNCIYSFSGQACTEQTVYWWQTYKPRESVDAVMSHVMGMIVALLVGLVAYGLYLWVRWLISGPRPYVDPCQDPNCPCARHEIERQEREAARNAAVAAAACAVIASTIINSP